MSLILLLACVRPDTGPPGETDGDDTETPFDTLDTLPFPDFPDHDTDTSGLPDSEPLASVDVLVIGSGAGGLGAAWTARDLGASVLVVERAAAPGGATVNAGNYWAAGTRWQAEFGVTDSPEQALSEWNDFTAGDASSPVTQRFVAESASVLEWLAGLGADFKIGSNVAADSGTVPREHGVNSEDGHQPPASLVSDSLHDVLVTNTTATELVLDGPTVAGAWVTDESGGVGWIHARSVVVATGGFTRNDAMVLDAIPALADFPVWYESFPGMDGNGLDLAAPTGAATQNLDHLGLYVHGVEDAKIGQPEVMVMVGLDLSLVVDGAGHRVADEREFGSVSMGQRYLTEGPFFAIFDDAIWKQTGMQGRGFNYIDDIDDLQLSAEAYETRHVVPKEDDPASLAADIGVEPTALVASLDAYNDDARTGVDTAFGKPAMTFIPLLAKPFRALPLVLARSKSFGGIATDDDGAVIDNSGKVIPGLFAAGEACGFLGTPAIGHGFNGSITAAWWSGLRAGAAAAKK
jgi:fumarate reductase flavoprotein subunit